MSKYRLLLTFIIILIIATAVLPKAHAQTVYTTTMIGSNSVTPNSSHATGTSTVTLLPDMKTIKLDLNYKDLLGPETNAHLHGPAAFGDFNAVLVIIPNGTPINNYVTTMTSEQVKWLQQGLIYADVHSKIYPDGEIRGWLKPEGKAEIPTTTPTSAMTSAQSINEPTHAPWYHTIFSVSVCIHNVGNCEINKINQKSKQPTQTQFPITITVANAGNKTIATQQGTITYNPTAGVFSGDIDMGSLTSGNYLITETVDGFPPIQQPGFLSVSSGTTNIFPVITETTNANIPSNKNWFQKAMQPGGILHFLQTFLDRF